MIRTYLIQLYLIMSSFRLDMSQSVVLCCYNCTNYPDKVVCGAKSACQGNGCYTVIEQVSDTEQRVANGCSNSITLQNRSDSCYQQTSTLKFCVCFENLCNTQLIVDNSGTLSSSPFSIYPPVPWNVAIDTTTTTTTTTTGFTTTSSMESMITNSFHDPDGTTNTITATQPQVDSTTTKLAKSSYEIHGFLLLICLAILRL